MIPAPERFLRFFDYRSACISYEFNDFVDFLLAVNIICQCNTTETISNLRRIIRVNIFLPANPTEIIQTLFQVCQRNIR